MSTAHRTQSRRGSKGKFRCHTWHHWISQLGAIRLACLVLLGCAALLPPSEVHAHPMSFGFLAFELDRGSFRAELTLNSMAFRPTEDEELTQARRRELLAEFVRENLELRFDKRPHPFVVKVLRFGDPDASGPEGVDVVALSGSIPERASVLTLRGTRALGGLVWTVRTAGNPDARTFIVQEGYVSEPYSLQGRNATDVERARTGSEAERAPFGAPREAPAESADDLLRVLRQYVVLGFEHIVPLGLDHILFVLGLYLLGTRFERVLLQLTLFTLAHSLTLALAALDVLRIPGSLVEPLIALSIVYVGIENVFTRDAPKHRYAVVFAFGLLHGLGFASVLRDIGLPEQRLVPALLAFNVGVELGQVAVVVAAAALTRWAVHRDWYRRIVSVPASLTVAAIGLFWTVQRVFF